MIKTIMNMSFCYSPKKPKKLEECAGKEEKIWIEYSSLTCWVYKYLNVLQYKKHS
jgi:hypothetical protein